MEAAGRCRRERGRAEREEQEGFTFDDEFGKVGDPGAPGGLGDAAVKVLVRPLDAVQLKGHHEAPVAQVLDGCCC